MNFPTGISYDELIFYGLIILLFLLTSAFFSAAETGLTAVSRARIFHLVMEGNKRARLVSKLRRNKESLIGSVLLGNNAVNIAASTLATSLSIRVFGDSEAGLAGVTLIMTLLVVIFSEILPKTYAIQNAERVSLALSPALNLLVTVLYPITATIQVLIHFILKLFGVDSKRSNNLVSATDVIRGTIELHHREGQMIKQDRDMLGSILDLNDIEVGQIMIHRTQVETINASLSPEALVAEAVSTMHSRIPLWHGQPDNIIGLLHVKNLIKALNEARDTRGEKLTSESLLAIAAKPWFIPETTSLRDQLLAFRSKRQHFAFVVDEYGAWLGIVTLEDIIEEIVGDINDEHDEALMHMQKVGEDEYIADGSLPVRDLNRRLDWNLPDDEAATLAGVLIHYAEKIPAVGESFEVKGFRFTVIEKDAMQVTRLRIARLPDTATPNDIDV